MKYMRVTWWYEQLLLAAYCSTRILTAELQYLLTATVVIASATVAACNLRILMQYCHD
jgi:hypothetical protein